MYNACWLLQSGAIGISFTSHADDDLAGCPWKKHDQCALYVFELYGMRRLLPLVFKKCNSITCIIHRLLILHISVVHILTFLHPDASCQCNIWIKLCLSTCDHHNIQCSNSDEGFSSAHQAQSCRVMSYIPETLVWWYKLSSYLSLWHIDLYKPQ